MGLTLVVGDGDTFPFALEKARFAHDAIRSVDHDRLLSSELELRTYGGVVDNVRKLVPRLQLKDIHRTNITTMRATGALFNLDDDLDHVRPLR